jgi:hypothetical protein
VRKLSAALEEQVQLDGSVHLETANGLLPALVQVPPSSVLLQCGI